MNHLMNFESFVLEGLEQNNQATTTVKPASTNILQPQTFNQEIVSTNTNILNKLNQHFVNQHVDLKLPPTIKPESKDFLPKVTSFLKTNGFKPQLRVKANKKGEIDTTGGIHWDLPGKDGGKSPLSIDLGKDYVKLGAHVAKGLDVSAGIDTTKKQVGGSVKFTF